MIVEYVYGDLIKSNCKVIAHGVNCQGVMGAGIAKQISGKYPHVYKAYNNRVRSCIDAGHSCKDLLGKCQVVETDEITVINMFTQENYGRDGRYVSYDAVAQCFESINKSKFKNIAIPKIGTGLAGGHWNIIREIINDYTPDLHISVYMLKTHL